MITTTLNKILSHDPCGQDPKAGEGWWKLLNYLGKNQADDEPLPLLTILESNGLDGALWALRAVEGYDREIRLYSCWCACQSLHVFEDKYPNDMRPRRAIETAALYAEGLSNKDDLAYAFDAATDGGDTAWYVARVAAREAANAAAKAAAKAAGEAVGEAAREAERAAEFDTEIDSARESARDAQRKEFIKLCKLEKKYMPMENN